MAVKMQLASVIMLLGLSIAGCQSYDPKVRRQQLLELYPPGVTTRDEVHAKWQTSPDFSVDRPAGDWALLDNAWIRDHVLAAQVRVGKPIYRCERFWGPDSVYSLCYCWFYYDFNNKLVDTEWEWKSD